MNKTNNLTSLIKLKIFIKLSIIQIFKMIKQMTHYIKMIISCNWIKNKIMK